MKWLSYEVARALDPAQWEVPPALRAYEMVLVARCSEMENGGLLVGAREWSSLRWRAFAGFPKALVPRLVRFGILEENEIGLRVPAYATEYETMYRRRVDQRRKAVESRWRKHTAVPTNTPAVVHATEVGPGPGPGPGPDLPPYPPHGGEPGSPPAMGADPVAELRARGHQAVKVEGTGTGALLLDRVHVAWPWPERFHYKRVQNALARIAHETVGAVPADVIVTAILRDTADPKWCKANERLTCHGYLNARCYLQAPKRKPTTKAPKAREPDDIERAIGSKAEQDATLASWSEAPPKRAANGGGH